MNKQKYTPFDYLLDSGEKKDYTEMRNDINNKYKLIKQTDIKNILNRKKNREEAKLVNKKFILTYKTKSENDNIENYQTPSQSSTKIINLKDQVDLRKIIIEKPNKIINTPNTKYYIKINTPADSNFNKTSTNKKIIETSNLSKNQSIDNQTNQIIQKSYTNSNLSTINPFRSISSDMNSPQLINNKILGLNKVNIKLDRKESNITVLESKMSSSNLNPMQRNTSFNFSKKQTFSIPTNLSPTKSIYISPYKKMSARLSFLKISPEDEIFDQFIKEEISERKNNNNPKLDAVKKKLFKIYNLDYDYLREIKQAKRLKNDMDLERYQFNLIQVLGDRISKESRTKLKDNLRLLSKLSNKIKSDDDINSFILNIERIEEVIVKNLSIKEELLERVRTSGTISINSTLPKIKFKSIIKNK